MELAKIGSLPVVEGAIDHDVLLQVGAVREDQEVLVVVRPVRARMVLQLGFQLCVLPQVGLPGTAAKGRRQPVQPRPLGVVHPVRLEQPLDRLVGPHEFGAHAIQQLVQQRLAIARRIGLGKQVG